MIPRHDVSYEKLSINRPCRKTVVDHRRASFGHNAGGSRFLALPRQPGVASLRADISAPVRGAHNLASLEIGSQQEATAQRRGRSSSAHSAPDRPARLK